jgi:hypothetical protein
MTTFRNALQVNTQTVRGLRDQELSELVDRLIQAQAYRCGVSASEQRGNAEIKNPDGGCDAWSGQTALPDDWLGSVATCWQFKAGVGGQPAKLAEEITKSIPQGTLKTGGRFVLVTNGSTNGVKGEEIRLKALQTAAMAAGLPAEQIDVFGCERLEAV